MGRRSNLCEIYFVSLCDKRFFSGDFPVPAPSPTRTVTRDRTLYAHYTHTLEAPLHSHLQRQAPKHTNRHTTAKAHDNRITQTRTHEYTRTHTPGSWTLELTSLAPSVLHRLMLRSRQQDPSLSAGYISVPDYDTINWDRLPMKKLAAMVPGSILNIVSEGLPCNGRGAERVFQSQLSDAEDGTSMTCVRG